MTNQRLKAFLALTKSSDLMDATNKVSIPTDFTSIAISHSGLVCGGYNDPTLARSDLQSSLTNAGYLYSGSENRWKLVTRVSEWAVFALTNWRWLLVCSLAGENKGPFSARFSVSLPLCFSKDGLLKAVATQLFQMDSFPLTALPCPAVYVLLDGRRWLQSHAAFDDYVKRLIDAGTALIQFRDKNLSDRDHVAIGHRLSQLTESSQTRWIMNDRVDLAIAAGADGVHLGQDDLSIQTVREKFGYRKLIGVSTHCVDQAKQAQAEGADYIGVGPVFSSTTKQFQHFVGVDLIKQVADTIDIPAFAIGGIKIDNVSQVRDAGMQRIAVAGVVNNATDPAQAVGELLEKLA